MFRTLQLPFTPTVAAAAPATATHQHGPLLKVEQLHVAFQGEEGDTEVISGIDFEVGRGEVVAVVGESGSGKSVTALAVMGLLPRFAQVTQGRVMFEGCNLLELPEESMRQRRGRDIGMIFQDPMSALNPVLTIGDQITEPLRIHLGMSPAKARLRAIELLGLVGIAEPDSRLDQFPYEFSGGMRQRVMIAIALACGPKLLIADEPTTALDVTIQAQILELMKDLAQRLGIALLIITHNLGIVARYADRLLVMYAGQLVEQGAADTLFYTPRHMYTLGLLQCVPHLHGDHQSRLTEIDGLPPNMRRVEPGCRFSPRCPQRRAACAGANQAIRTDVGSLSRCVRSGDLAAGRIGWAGPRAEVASGAAAGGAAGDLLRVQAVSRAFRVRRGVFGSPRTVYAVSDVDFGIAPGETLGLVGESGCGKSTLARMVLRLDRPTSGRIRFEGRDITELGHSQMQAVRRRMQVVFQDPSASLNPRKTIGELIGEPLRVHGITRGREQTIARVMELLQLVGLRTDFFERYSHQISGGQRQRVGIARALALEPSFIVCDEAVSALDVSVQAQVVNLLGDLQQRYGLAYLFIAHDLALVRHISTRVMVMYLGRVVERAPRDALYDAPLHPYTRLLLEAVPTTDPQRERERRHGVIQGELPSPFAPPSGCAFRTRCPLAVAECAVAPPPLREIRPEHFVACIRA
ncbi:MAG: dipeptide ABC transporter ATP-binding protein [Pigmentiphaga sp.]